jgi:hypothetical protein
MKKSLRHIMSDVQDMKPMSCEQKLKKCENNFELAKTDAERWERIMHSLGYTKENIEENIKYQRLAAETLGKRPTYFSFNGRKKMKKSKKKSKRRKSSKRRNVRRKSYKMSKKHVKRKSRRKSKRKNKSRSKRKNKSRRKSRR